MNTRHPLNLLAAGLLVLGTSVQSGAKINPESIHLVPSQASRVNFQAVGRPSLLKIKGEGATVRGSLTISDGIAQGRFEVSLDQFKTGIDLRDEHMKDTYLKTKEHPTTVLDIQSLALPPNWKPGMNLEERSFEGELTLKGTTKKVVGKVRASGEDLKTTAEITISLNDFNIGVPKYMGITVADQVTIQVEIPRLERK